MRNRLVIIGAGGHGKVVADLAVKNGYTDIVFLDDHATGKCLQYPILGTSAETEALHDGNTDFVLAIGNNAARKKTAEAHPVNWVSLVHPSAQIGLGVTIGSGTVVLAGAVINACATVGRHCIVNTCSVVEHDDRIGDYVHLSPNAALGGTVRIGEGTHIGIGATVKNNIEICEGCTVGAGAVVVKQITEKGTYVGVPAKRMQTAV